MGYGLKVSRSWNKNCNVVTSPKKWTNEFIFLSWWSRNIWNLNFDFKFQVFLDRQDKKNKLVCLFFFGRNFSSTILFWDLMTFIRSGLTYLWGTQRIGQKDHQIAYILTLVFWIMRIRLCWPQTLYSKTINQSLPAFMLRNLILKSAICNCCVHEIMGKNTIKFRKVQEIFPY